MEQLIWWSVGVVVVAIVVYLDYLRIKGDEE